MKIFINIVIIIFLLNPNGLSAKAKIKTLVPPAAPTNLQITNHTTSGAILTWQDNSNNELGFEVERRKGDLSWTLITTTAAGAITYTDIGPDATTRNFPLTWRVRATNADGNSAYTNLVYNTLPPSPLPTPSTSWTDIFSLASFPTPTKPARGGTVYDPLFGAPLCRITEESITSSNGPGYSYWTVYNADNTRIYEFDSASGGIMRLHVFNANPTLGQPCVTGASTIIAAMPDGSSPFFGGGAPMWHTTDPTIFYGVGARGIYQYDLDTSSWTLYADADAILDSGFFLKQCQMEYDMPPRRFGCQRASPGDVDEGVIAFEKAEASSTTTVLYQRTEDEEVDGSSVNEVTISKGGDYFILAYFAGGERSNATVKIALDAGNAETVMAGTNFSTPSHYDSTYTHLFGPDDDVPGLLKQPFSDTTPGIDWVHKDLGHVPDFGSYHISARAADAIGWINLGFYADAKGTRALDGELALVSIAAPAQVKRYSHHFSDSNDAARYYDTPRASLSMNGKFAAIASTWGTDGTSREMYSVSTPLNVAATTHKTIKGGAKVAGGNKH